MSRTGEHPVASMDATVTADNLHERAEAVAVPDFDYLEQTFAGIASALTGQTGGTEPDGPRPPARRRRAFRSR
ncbi:hypothetical protein [Micromonospora chersina]|uniref:hypothetical protein n=1 Tax=Micromonospora chersina TaxID=47854 RepID=UPI0033D461AF